MNWNLFIFINVFFRFYITTSQNLKNSNQITIKAHITEKEILKILRLDYSKPFIESAVKCFIAFSLKFETKKYYIYEHNFYKSPLHTYIISTLK